MAQPSSPPVSESREARVEAIMEQLRPKIEEAVRQLVERAVEVPEAEEFGAIDFEFRDAGLNLVNEVRQAAVASRKKRGTQGRAGRATTADTPPSSTRISNGGC